MKLQLFQNCCKHWRTLILSLVKKNTQLRSPKLQNTAVRTRWDALPLPEIVCRELVIRGKKVLKHSTSVRGHSAPSKITLKNQNHFLCLSAFQAAAPGPLLTLAPYFLKHGLLAFLNQISA